LYDQEVLGSERDIETSGETAPERLKRVFNEEPLPRREGFVPENPRYGRDEPAYEPPGSGEPHQPVIKVVGVGGAGVNAVNRMVDARIPGVEFMAVNTDLQSLQLCVADVTVHIGDEQTRGLGAGADPEVGHRSAFEEQDKIKRLLKGSDMVFVAAGAGGGTGSGAAPVVARLAREVGALTVGIVTKPFSFEGSRRGEMANKGIEELAAEVDTLIVVPNDRLLDVLDQQTSMVEAFKVADDVLRQGVQGISDLVTLPAVINLDFADVRSIMSEAGRALLGIGMAYGDDRAVLAAEKAISSPLLETSMEGARSILLSITGGADLSLVEVSEAAKVVGEAAHPEANIIFGANVDEELSEQIWVTVVATRFDGRAQPQRRAAEPTIRRTKDAEPARRGRGGERELGIDVPEFLPG
jgi:cell division protein FtsZ